MDLSHFDMQAVSFEVRFEPSFIIYDKAGSIWSGIQGGHPTLKLSHVTPEKVDGVVDDKFQISIELERIAVHGFKPSRNFGEFTEFCSEVIDRGVTTLKVGSFDRVGLRVVYRKSCRHKDEPSAFLLSLGLMKVPDGKHFGISGKVKNPHYAMKWEDEDFGVQINIRAQERKIKVEPPLGEAVFEAIDKDLFELDYDIDYYAQRKIGIGQFRTKDWIDNAMRLIRRDSKVFLGN